MKLLLSIVPAALLLLSAANGPAQTKQASVVANCRSVALASSSGVWPGYGTVYNVFTTYDGSSGFPLHDVVNGNWEYSEELRPRAGRSGVYEADFVTYNTSGSYIEYGSFTINAPTTDSDSNGLPDFAQKNKAVNATISGSGRMDWAYTGATGFFNISGHLSRSANSQTGNYSMTVGDASGSVTYAGTWGLQYVSGTITYQREPNVLTFNLVSSGYDGSSNAVSGSTVFVVNNPNQITLPQVSLTNSEGEVISIRPGVLNRSGNKYIGNLQLVDGNTATSWPDFTAWVMEITDTNDSNTNGVPDLSDLGIAPAIIVQPTNQVVGLGRPAAFAVLASGSSPLQYHWRFNGSDYPACTDATLLISSAQLTNAGSYRVIITNAAGSVTSAVATLTVIAPPVITANPKSQNAKVGGNATFSVTASGTNLQYRWWLLGGAGTSTNTWPAWTNSTLNLVGVSPPFAGGYFAVVTNLGGVAISSVATLIISPTITNQPQSQTVAAGNDATFWVGATGLFDTYRWRFNGATLPGKTDATLLIAKAQPTNAGNYSVVITNAAGAVTSAVATLSVVLPPTITVQPQSQTVAQRSNATLRVTASGTAPLGYQWRFNGANLAGATVSSLIRTNFQKAHEGPYDVVVSNSAGTTTSTSAWLYLNGPLRFTNCTASADGLFRARLLGVAGSRYVIQASSNLTTWSSLQTNLAANGIFDFVDTNSARLDHRFYRAK